MGKERAYSAKPSITTGDQCRASLPGLALLLSMGAGGGPWGPQATGLMPAALGQTPEKPPGQIPCQHASLICAPYTEAVYSETIFLVDYVEVDDCLRCLILCDWIGVHSRIMCSSQFTEDVSPRSNRSTRGVTGLHELTSHFTESTTTL
jgi:hypothetical protein